MPMARKPGVNSVTLTALRRRRGLRSGELDKKSGRDEGTLSRLEGKEDLSWELLVELATVKEMDYDLEEVESAAFGLARATEPARSRSRPSRSPKRRPGPSGGRRVRWAGR